MRSEARLVVNIKKSLRSKYILSLRIQTECVIAFCADVIISKMGKEGEELFHLLRGSRCPSKAGGRPFGAGLRCSGGEKRARVPAKSGSSVSCKIMESYSSRKVEGWKEIRGTRQFFHQTKWRNYEATGSVVLGLSSSRSWSGRRLRSGTYRARARGSLVTPRARSRCQEAQMGVVAGSSAVSDAEDISSRLELRCLLTHSVSFCISGEWEL